jgi:hypothetical protein
MPYILISVGGLVFCIGITAVFVTAAGAGIGAVVGGFAGAGDFAGVGAGDFANKDDIANVDVVTTIIINIYLYIADNINKL